MLCDTVELKFNSTSVALVRPFQVHSVGQVSDDAEGYFISAAPFLVPDACSQIFQNLELSGQTKKIEEPLKTEFINYISLLHNSFDKKQSNKGPIINGLFNALIYTFSNLFETSILPTPPSANQSVRIAANFKKLIQHDNLLKSPSFFAKKLNISTSHLNDCVNLATGKSVTHWLQSSIILEAQRLLYYTENDVKEIAYTLGFADHSYFSRLFKKKCNETPLSFRKKFRE